MGLVAIALVFVGPIPQAHSYHDFSDQAERFGIPHFANVISNLPFLLVGLWGLLRSGVVADSRLRNWLLIAVVLVGFGSSWYHLHPTNQTLIWDRLPIACVSVSVFLWAMKDFGFLKRVGLWLAPMHALALLSVLHWSMTDDGRGGDLRSYLLISALPALVALYGLALRPTRSRHRAGWTLVLILYALARAAEIWDRAIHGLPLLLSGHTYKHLLAAAACLVLVQMMSAKDPLD
jgi:hypothetical protein